MGETATVNQGFAFFRLSAPLRACAYARQDARALYECSESPDVYAMDEGG